MKRIVILGGGANILFKSSSNPKDVISFIKDNIELGIKVI
jgi:hypothetical protein